MAEEPTPSDYIEGDISHLGMAAVQVHELFLELKRAGFTHKESLQLAGDVLAHAVVDPYDADDEEEDLDFVQYEITFTGPEEATEGEEPEPQEDDEAIEKVLPDEEEPGNISED